MSNKISESESESVHWFLRIDHWVNEVHQNTVNNFNVHTRGHGISGEYNLVLFLPAAWIMVDNSQAAAMPCTNIQEKNNKM